MKVYFVLILSLFMFVETVWAQQPSYPPSTVPGEGSIPLPPGVGRDINLVPDSIILEACFRAYLNAMQECSKLSSGSLICNPVPPPDEYTLDGKRYRFPVTDLILQHSDSFPWVTILTCKAVTGCKCTHGG